jgi:hypothetical protein
MTLEGPLKKNKGYYLAPFEIVHDIDNILKLKKYKSYIL